MPAYESLTDLLVFTFLGIIAIVAAITYNRRKKPYGYLGLGDVSVLIFLFIGSLWYLLFKVHQWCNSIFYPHLQLDC